MFNKIIVPTDGSEHAKKAVTIAIDLAERYATDLLIFHVLLSHTPAYDVKSLCSDLNAPAPMLAKLDELDETMYNTAAVAYAPVPLLVPDNILAEVSELILNSAKKLAEEKGMTAVSTASAIGDPATCIIDTAEQYEADLIVMGSRGLGKFADLFMGSVSHKVSNLAKCTCVTVK